MGCDIHFHTEVKIKGTWHHHSQAKLDRNYPVFAKMAGVRNGYGIEPIISPRGIPGDITLLTRIEIEKYDGDGHSHSWFGPQEIVAFHDFFKQDGEYEKIIEMKLEGWRYEHENIPYFLGNHMDGFVKYPQDWERYGVEDVRYVFFFDN